MTPRYVAAVALYGTKAGALKTLLESVQEICADRLRDSFRPYSLDQVHATIVGLGGTVSTHDGLIVNEHYRELAGTSRAIDHAQALEILAAGFTPPLGIRIGGFGPDDPMMFSSQGQHPHQRTFSAPDGALVMMGWPASAVNGSPDRELDRIRRKMNAAGILHRYHQSWTDVDNDFHLVVGHYDAGPQGDIDEAVRAIRDHLSGRPVQIDVGIGQLSVVASDSTTLAPAQFIGRFPVDARDLMNLYR
jgi:hypothetical protein